MKVKRKDSLHQPKSTMEMNRKMDRITLLEHTLDLKLEKYEAEEFDETYVEKKVGLKRLEEVERVQEELVDKIDGFLREFPTSEMTENYKSLKVLSLIHI